MKRTRKLILALVVVMSLLMAMAVAIIPASAANMKGGETLYLKAGTNWKKDGARFAVYFFNNSTNKNTWASMTRIGTSDYYEVTVPNGDWANLIFCRMNPSTTENNWDNRWNQTANLTYSSTKNLFTVSNSTWDGATTTWSKWSSSNCTGVGGHKYGEYTFNEDATCLENGTKVASCVRCGASSGNVTAENTAKGHTFDTVVEAKTPGCSSDGNDAYKKCTVCNLYFAGNADTNATNGTETNEGFLHPSTGEHGYTYECDKVCVDCGLVTNPDASHKIEHVEAKTPTCTDDGNIEHWLCTYCGSCWTDAACTQVTNSKNVIISATGHSHEAVVTEPTCIEAGYITYTCACGDSYIEAGAAATGHTFVDEKCACGQNQYIIVYFQNNWLWTNVSIYAFNEGGFIGEAWPGAKATFVKNDGTYDIYSAKVPYNATGIIFNGVKNDGSGNSDQTPDITSNITNCVMFYMHYDSKEGTQARIADKGIHTYVDGKCSACGHEAETFEEAITGTGTVKVPVGGATVAQLTVQPGLVIDLNGQVLKATSLVTFAADAIIDSSAKWENGEFVEPTGLLIIPKFKIAIPTLGLYMPIWNTVNGVSGYQFVEMEDQQKVVDTVKGDDSFNVVFRPSIGDTEFNNKIFGDVENNGLEFVINVYNGTLVDGEFVADPEGTPISGKLDPATVATAYEDNAVKAVNVKFTGADFTDGNCYSIELFIRIKTLDDNGTETYINAYYTILAVVGASGEI